MSKTITRVLSVGISYGAVAVRERDLTDAEFDQLTMIIDNFFVSKGVEA